MARRNGHEEGHHKIRLPGEILDQVKDKEDDRFTQKKGKKRKPVALRRERRKQERELKKHKKGKPVPAAPEPKPKAPSPKPVEKKRPEPKKMPVQLQYDSDDDEFDSDELRELREMEGLESESEEESSSDDDDPFVAKGAKKAKPEEPKEQEPEEPEEEPEEDDDEAATMAALLALKKGKKSSSEVRVVKEDDLGDDSFSDGELLSDEEMDDEDDEEDPMARLMALKKGKKASSEVRVVKEDDLDDDSLSDDDFGDDESDDEDPMAKLAALKKGKKSTSDVRVVKEDDLGDESLSDDFDDEEDEEVDDGDDEEDTMAKLAALKKGKKSKTEVRVVKEDDLEEDDDLSDDFGIEDEDNEDDNDDDNDDFGGFSDDEPAKPKKEPRVLSIRERELMERDDKDAEYYAKKLGMKSAKGGLKKIDDDDDIGGLLDGLDFGFGSDGGSDAFDEPSDSEESDASEGSESEDENPFVAAQEPAEPLAGSKYIPPALRRKMEAEAGAGVSAEVQAIRKDIKGPLNKLSEANVGVIVNDINLLYLKYPRNVVTEELTATILALILQQGRLLDTFVYLHAVVVLSIHRLQGVEFGANFIQTLVEKLEATPPGEDKNASNLVLLLLSVYLFQLVGSRLIYDMIKQWLDLFDEHRAELLLRLVRSSGNQMRLDDPLSLKDIVVATNEVFAKLEPAQVTPRIQFLVETITLLKNNKLKPTLEDSHKLAIRLKKFMSTAITGAAEPIQVSLDDIHQVETRGKWWLVGAAWKGDDSTVNRAQVALTLDRAAPLWTQLAGARLMNSDIRKAIFISIKQAEDFVDALTRIDKLGLKKAQEREIPLVLVLCMQAEPVWNPYYGALARKLCEQHSFRKTFQFMFWDHLRQIDEDPDLDRTFKLARFYGMLLGEGLPLHALRQVNFVTASSDMVVFLEVLFVSFFDRVGKALQVKLVGIALKGQPPKFNPQRLAEMFNKADEQVVMLQGLDRFLGQVRHSHIIETLAANNKKLRKRVEWGVDTSQELIQELVARAKD